MAKQYFTKRIYSPHFDWDMRLGQQLLHLNYSLSCIDNNIHVLDFKNMKFTPPILAVYYASVLSDTHLKISYKGLNSYLETIRFPEGLCPEKEND